MRPISYKSTALAAAAVFVSFSAFAQQGSQQGSNSGGNSGSSTGSAGSTGSGSGSTGSGGSGSMGSMHSKSGAKGLDMKFVHDAAVGGMQEVQMGTIATQKGTSSQVKQFGQKLVDDHTKANDQLKSIASKSNMTVPTDLDPKAKAMVDKFTAMPAGPAFDKAFMHAMATDHAKDIAEFQKEADNGTDPDLKSFASTQLPTLQDHLKMAKDAGTMSSSSKKM